MENSTNHEHNTPENKNSAGGIFSLMLKQTIISALCLVFILGMKSAPNSFLNNCAAALSEAIRYDAKWEESVINAVGHITHLRKDNDNADTDTKYPQKDTQDLSDEEASRNLKNTDEIQFR